MRWTLPLLLILSGCGGAPTPVKTADGEAYRVSCGGPFSSKLECNEQANRMCPAGFNPISSPLGELVFTCSNRPVPANAPIDQ